MEWAGALRVAPPPRTAGMVPGAAGAAPLNKLPEAALPLACSPPHLCSRLRFLTLTNCELLVLPPVVRGMAGLQLLKLNINRLQVGAALSSSLGTLGGKAPQAGCACAVHSAAALRLRPGARRRACCNCRW